MNWKRIFTLAVIAGAFAALVTSAATTGRRRVVMPAPDSVRTRAVEVSGAALAAEIARLRERLHPTTLPQRPARNLFQFEPRSKSRTVATPDAAAAPIEVVSQAPPPMTLIGIAEDPGTDGVIRTAIISGFGDLFLVKEGELITPRYKVAKISGDVVEFTDRNDASIIRLALK